MDNIMDNIREKITTTTATEAVIIRINPSLAIVARDGHVLKVVASTFNKEGRRVIADITPRTAATVRDAMALYKAVADLFDHNNEGVIVKQL